MTRYLSMTLLVTLLSAKVVWAGLIAYGLPYPNIYSFTAEEFSVSAPVFTRSFADLAPVFHSFESTISTKATTLPDALRWASSDPSVEVVSNLSPTESLARTADHSSDQAPTLLQSVPEPATIALLGIALLLLAAAGQRRFTAGALQEAGRASPRGTGDLPGDARGSVVLHD